MHKYRNTEMQEYGNAGIRKYKNTEIHKDRKPGRQKINRYIDI
jgi:hypothetical protein